MGRAIGSVVLGVLALIAHLGALFVVLAYSENGLWYLPAAAIGLAAVVVGWMARKRLPVRTAGRGLATLGMVLGAISLVYFGLVVADGIASRPDPLTLPGERLSLSEYRIRADAICSEELAQLDERATVDEDASLETYQQRLKPIAAGLESAADRLSEFRPPTSVEPDAFRMVNNFATAADQLGEAIEADDKTEAVGKVHEAIPVAVGGFEDAQRLGLSTCTNANEDGIVQTIAPLSTNEDGSVPAIPPASTNKDGSMPAIPPTNEDGSIRTIPPSSTNEDEYRGALPPTSKYARQAGTICTEEMARWSRGGADLPPTRENLRLMMKEAAAVLETLTDRLSDLRPPERVQSDVDQMLTSFASAAAETEKASKKVENLADASRRIEQDVGPQLARAIEIAYGIGIQGCAPG